MARPTRSESPSGTFGRRSVLRGSSTDDDDGEVVPSARVLSKQRQIDEAEEHLRDNSDHSTPSSRSNLQDSSPSSELSHHHPLSSPTPGSKTPVHGSTDDSQDAALSPAHRFRTRYGIGERGGADSIPPLTRTLSPNGLDRERRQDAERARLLLNHAAEGDDKARLRRSDRDVSQSQLSTPAIGSGSSGSGDPNSDLWQALQSEHGGKIPSARMDDVTSFKRQSAISDSTAATATSQNGGRQQSLKFLTPLTPREEALGRRRLSDVSTLKGPSSSEDRRGRVRSVPTDVLRTMQRPDSRQSLSPLTDTRRRHQSLQAPGVHLPLPPALMLRSDSEPFPSRFSQTSIPTDPSLLTRSWRPSAATHFSDLQDAKDFVAHQRKVSDAYSAAAVFLEPHLPKTAIGTSQADPFVSAPLLQSLALALKRMLVPLRFVVPFLVTIFFDFNALFILAELASQSDLTATTGPRRQAAWWIAFAVYAFSAVLQQVFFSYLVTRAYLEQADPSRALAVPTYLSLYGRLLLILRKESLEHFVSTVDKAATFSQRLTESAWRCRQAWRTEATQVPRLVIAIVYLILYSYPSNSTDAGSFSTRDPFFFDQTSGNLSRYSFATTLANIAWISINLFVVLLASLWVITKNFSQDADREDAARWEEERMLSSAHVSSHATPRWQQDTRDRICLALLELERATSLDQMNRLPIHSTRSRSSRLGKGASLSGSVLGSASPISAIRSPEVRASGVTYIDGGFGAADAQQMPTSMRTGSDGAPVIDLDFPTEDSYHRFLNGVENSGPRASPGAVPFPKAPQNSSDGGAEEPSRSYLSHPLASGGVEPVARPSTTQAPAVLLDGDEVDWESTSEVPSDPDQVRATVVAPEVEPARVEPARTEDRAKRLDSEGAGNDGARDRFPSWPSRLSLFRSSGSLKRKKHVQNVEAERNRHPAEQNHYVSKMESQSTAATQGEESNRFWSNWFGSRGRRRTDSASRQSLVSLTQSGSGSVVDGNDMARVASRSEPSRRVVGFATPGREEQAATPGQSEERLDAVPPQRHVQMTTPTSQLGTEESRRSSSSSEDSEERRLWATFPDQSRRYPPGLIALELQERARQEAEQRRLAVDSPGEEDHSNDGCPRVAHSQQDLCVSPSLMSLVSEQDAHAALAYARSPSEGGLMVIREESSTYGDGSSGTVRSGEALSRNHSLASTGGRGGASGLDRSGSDSSEMTSGGVGPSGGGMSTSTSAASGLASVEEG